MSLTAATASPLESALLDAVQAAHFEQVIDFGAGNESHPVKTRLNQAAPRVAHPPNVNVAVIQLDPQGRMVDRAYVLLSRDYPKGLIVPLEADRGAGSVRFLRWNIERSDGGTFGADGARLSTKGWEDGPALTAQEDLLSGRPSAPYRFMAPYPASLFKSLIAFHLMRMVDAGKITLDRQYEYAVSGAAPERRRVRDWIEPMITVSDNHATSAMLKLLHDFKEIEALNRQFRDWNLGTLQIESTNPLDGRGWRTDRITMTAYDAVRLFWLIDGGAGVLWRGADGRPVSADVLSDSSRFFLKQLLLDQGFNDVLSTANFPGAPHVAPGIPHGVPERWINPTNGHVYLEGTDFGVDVRESNRRAEVTFAHKTGLTFNYASDAGIVRSLPGQRYRHYVIALIANLGHRYADEVFALRKTFPAFDAVSPLAYTQRIPGLGRAVDEALCKLSAARINP